MYMSLGDVGKVESIKKNLQIKVCLAQADFNIWCTQFLLLVLFRPISVMKICNFSTRAIRPCQYKLPHPSATPTQIYQKQKKYH